MTLLAKINSRGLLEMKKSRAANALLGMPSLKDRFNFFLNAQRAKVVQRLPVAFRFFKSVYDRTHWRFPKFIALFIAVKGLKLTQLHLQRSDLLNKKRARMLRICYLKSKLADSAFDITVCTRLRALEKGFYSGEGTSDLPGGRAGVSGQIYGLLNTLEIEVHKLDRLSKQLGVPNA